MDDVRVEQGLIAGAETEGIYQFLGLPYASPPVGERRWRPPAPPECWDGVRDATKFGNAAIQTAYTGFDCGAEQSEDCLYLNVWTPTLDSATKQPVMVWIHGGGFLNGAASMGIWTGEELSRQGVTVLSLNYRLGAFGFLAHPEVGANFGVLDWVAALTWVSKNIGAFGGDPNNVTVFGQSAGGAAVRALLSTPSATGLFHRAIIQSAGFVDYAVVSSPSYERSAEATLALFDRLGSRDIDELRQAPTEQVREASYALAGTFPPPGQVHTPANLTWYPVQDNDVMTGDDFAGAPSDVPVMLGCTQHEARFFVQPTLLYSHPEVDPAATYTHETLGHMAKVLGGNRADAIVGYFADSGLTPYEAIAELITVAVWHEPALATVRAFAGQGRTTFYYRFARVSPGGLQSGLLAKHSAEIPYLFGKLMPPQAYEKVDAEVSHAVQHAWVEFARTGVPRNTDGTPWPQYAAGEPRFTVIGDTAQSLPLEVPDVTEMIRSQRKELERA